MLISPQRIRWLFMAKAIIVPVAWLAMLIWAFVKVPVNSSGGLFNQHSTLSGSDMSWAWLSALNSALGIYSTLAVNIPDFTVSNLSSEVWTICNNFTSEICEERTSVSYLSRLCSLTQMSHSLFNSQYVQLAIIPVAFTLCGFIGMAVTSAGIVLYGQTLWDPLKLINQWDNRAAAFFASFAFVLATLGTNIAANSLSAANDMTVLFPRYINIRRGQMLCALLGGWALCPWEILARYLAVI